MALRRTAERVDDQMRAYMQTRAIPGPWPAGERLLVCVSSSPLSERLVRTARRLADELNAEWFAVYVETPGDAGLSQADRDQVARTLQLAEELGAKAVTLPGQSVADTVLEYARQHNVTKIIAGKPRAPALARAAARLRRGSPDPHSGDIDVYVISGEAETRQPRPRLRPWRPHRPWQRYLWSAGSGRRRPPLLSVPVHRVVSPANLVMLYLAAVVIAAIYLGRGPAILASVLSVLAFDFFFVPPRLTFTVADTEYLLTFVGLFVVGLVISSLAARSREQAEAAQPPRDADRRPVRAQPRPGWRQRPGRHPAGGHPARQRDLRPRGRRPAARGRGAAAPCAAARASRSTRTSWPSPPGRSGTASRPAAAPTRSRRPRCATCP